MFSQIRRFRAVGTVTSVGLFVAAALSGCAGATTPSERTTSPRPEITTTTRPGSVVPSFTPPVIDHPYYDALFAAIGKGRNLVRAGISVHSPTVRRSMIEQAAALYRAVPLPQNDYSMADYRLIQQARADLNAMAAAISARDDAAFANGYADFLTVSDSLDSDISSSDSSSDDSLDDEPPPWDDAGVYDDPDYNDFTDP